MEISLDNLILRIEKGINKKSAWIESIRDPPLLLKSLKQLQKFIGNQKVKKSVALQVNYLILNQHRQRLNKELNEDDVMLNCILSGKPGHGKTQLGTILAKIWHGLGQIKLQPKKVKPTLFDNLTDALDDHVPTNTNTVNIFLFILLIWVIALVINFYQSYGGLLTLTLIITLIIVVAIIFYQTETPQPPPVIKKPKTVEQKEIKELPDSHYVTVVSRADFVGEYVGKTAMKTNELLTKNLGKVLIVDEAYSLMNNAEDPFGIEALTTMNLFMSQHPNEIIIVFAGYHHLIEKLFTAQPGLERRFMYHFEMTTYDSNDLFDIFKLKLDHKRWKLSNLMETKALFNKYEVAFPNAGGDVERLVFFSTLHHAHSFLQSDNEDINTLEPHHIEAGILQLIDNNQSSMKSARTRTESQTPSEQFSHLFDTYYKQHQSRTAHTYDTVNADREPTVEDLSMEETESIRNTFKTLMQRQY